MEKLFTKSVFKLALDCPCKIYYYRNKDKYFNADDNNDFLSSLAEQILECIKSDSIRPYVLVYRVVRISV